MKITAEQYINMMITATTERSAEDIGHAINHAKSVGLKDVNDEYNVLFENITKYDMTKEHLENETKIAIEAMNTANFYYSGSSA